MLDRILRFICLNLFGVSLITLLGLIVRSFPFLYRPVYLALILLAIIFAILLSLKNEIVSQIVLLSIVVGILGVILAGL